MSDKEKLAAAISALMELEGVPIRFDLHEPIRELQEQLGHCILEIEDSKPDACEQCETQLSELCEHEGEWLCGFCIRDDNIRQMQEMDDVSNLMGG